MAERGINDIIARTAWHIIRPIMACRRFHWNKNLKKFDIKVLDEKQWRRQNIVLGVKRGQSLRLGEGIFRLILAKNIIFHK